MVWDIFTLFSRRPSSGTWLIPIRHQPEGALTDRAAADRVLHLFLLHRHHQRRDRGSGWRGWQRGKLQWRLPTGPVRWRGGTCWHSPHGPPRNRAAQKLRRQRHAGPLVAMQGETHSLKLGSSWGHENLFYISAQTEGVLMSSQMFLHGLMRHFEMKVLEPCWTLFVLSLESSSFQTVSTVIFASFFPKTNKSTQCMIQFFILPAASELYRN